MFAIRPIATNSHTESPGFGNPKLVGIPVQDHGRVRPTSWLIWYDQCSSGFHSMSFIQTRRKIPPQIKAKKRVHHAKRCVTRWLPLVVLGALVRGSFILILILSGPVALSTPVRLRSTSSQVSSRACSVDSA